LHALFTVSWQRMIKRVPIGTQCGTFEVFTKRLGDDPRRRVLLVHGGPGATHQYLEPLEALHAELVFYDQLGSAHSDQPDDDRLWTVERFVDEVEQVRIAYELDDFILYGHSWGAMLALEYALAHGSRLKGLVLSNALPSIPDHNRGVQALIDGLGLTVSHPELVPRVFAEHMCRLKDWPPPLVSSFGSIHAGLSRALRGDSQLFVGGRLAHWDRKADLGRLAMPTLVISARHDVCPDQQRAMADAIPHGSFALCPDGSHLPMWDDRDVYLQQLQAFIDRVAH
jgi:proline iminopeptidase